jgi:hypothetical protein
MSICSGLFVQGYLLWFSDIVVLLTEAAADLLCEYNKLDAVAGSSINDPVALYLTAQP